MCNDAALIIGDHDRANVLRDQNIGDVSQRPIRLDRDDVSALSGENTRDCHFCLPEKVLRSTFDRLCFGRPQAAANYHHKMHSVSSLRKSTVAMSKGSWLRLG
jgi:hypothetical protein